MNLFAQFARPFSITFIPLLVLAGCESEPPEIEVSEEALFSFGEHPVGFRETTLSYSAPGMEEDREIPLLLWYPADEGTEAAPMRYAVAGIVSVVSEVALDAPRAAAGGGFPLAIYSHGSGGEPLLGYPFGELLASHGWVVAAPGHVGNTTMDYFPGKAPAPFARNALNRPSDVVAVIDGLESDLEGEELVGQVDTSRVFVFGHSFGGATALAVAGADQDFDVLSSRCGGEDAVEEDCQVYADPEVEAAYREGFGDPRVVAIAPQAPALIPTIEPGDLASLELPTLLMTGLMDQTTTHQVQSEPAWEGLDHPDDIWVEMPRGGHYSFITICHDLDPELLAAFRPDAPDDGCDFDRFTSTTEAVPVLSAYLLAFGRRHVLGETGWDELLRGDPLGEIDDQLEITTR